jgi:uncharacterized protein (TIGR02996 family)
MPDAESFVAAVAANPADDLPRLVFADWLDENGDPARAAFIRDHVRLAKLRPGTDEYKALFRKCADTLRANLPAWIKPACDACGQPAEWKPGKATGGRFGIVLGGLTSPHTLLDLEFARGLVERVSLNMHPKADLLSLAVAMAANPITRLRVFLRSGNPHWEQSWPERSYRVTSLEVGGGPSAMAPAVFNSPHLSGVMRLAIASLSTGDVVEALCRSPLARRLTCLRVRPTGHAITALAEFPLDDRLAELVLLMPESARAVEPGAAYWSSLSRVSFRPTLKRLDLTRCGMTDDGLAAFARGEEWVRLQGLKLGGNLFGDRGWADFCRGWRTPELTYLDASRNRLTDAGAEMLARSGMLKTLRVIDLRGNRIAGRGAVALARAVAEGKVQKLLLAGNPLGKRESANVKGLLGGRTDLA